MDARFLAEQLDAGEPSFAVLNAAAHKLRQQATDLDNLRKRIADAPIAYMDTRAELGLCAMEEGHFKGLYALAGKKVRLVVED